MKRLTLEASALFACCRVSTACAKASAACCRSAIVVAGRPKATT